ncbi:PREDICTED: nuclear pore complex protein Nup50 [Chinchilla lanigera]|uniref:nuclear pore complex protein Nup50 n=1 Tax=Chinchilla lanigera TaxID=34839 RepID=UPI0006967CC8|nr:PREDICTED: nuclear pore complex protein Nup50 [Chinchilla lanigera]XP_013367081.1 PREDICTED: nuclear pore complex protein Nup50 [Chinchilla lanigera]
MKSRSQGKAAPGGRGRLTPSAANKVYYAQFPVSLLHSRFKKMAKRIAEKELTDRNWDQEDEAEELGTFSVASEEVLKNRAIKKAKRRNVGFESDSGGAFKGFKGLVMPSGGAGFSGFGGKPLEGLSNGTSAASAPAFATAGTSAASTPAFATTGTSATVAAEPKATFGSFATNGPTAMVDRKIANPKTNGDSQQRSSSGLASSQACLGDTYHKQLAALNCSVRDWIVQHVDANPVCDLTPVFKDYENYLATIGQQSKNQDSSSSESETSRMIVETQPPLFASTKLQQESTFLFSSSKTEDASEKKMEVVSEKKVDPAQGATSASFSFGKKIDSSVLGSSSGPPAGFSFSPGNSSLFGKDLTQSKPVSSPFSAKTLASQAEGSNECKGGDEEENEEPPKVVVTEVKEEDAFYSKKCKLFYKKDNEFKEKGVGTLHLKPMANQKTQLLVRADTNLGNILLNVLIPPNMPCTRTGKNNVLIVCVPNPPLDEKSASAPTTMLIRVKTSEDADELHKILLEKKEA